MDEYDEPITTLMSPLSITGPILSHQYSPENCILRFASTVLALRKSCNGNPFSYDAGRYY